MDVSESEETMVYSIYTTKIHKIRSKHDEDGEPKIISDIRKIIEKKAKKEVKVPLLSKVIQEAMKVPKLQDAISKEEWEDSWTSLFKKIVEEMPEYKHMMDQTEIDEFSG